MVYGLLEWTFPQVKGHHLVLKSNFINMQVYFKSTSGVASLKVKYQEILQPREWQKKKKNLAMSSALIQICFAIIVVVLWKNISERYIGRQVIILNELNKNDKSCATLNSITK